MDDTNDEVKEEGVEAEVPMEETATPEADMPADETPA